MTPATSSMPSASSTSPAAAAANSRCATHPLGDADFCCGAAGIYNLTQPELSQRILARKIEHIKVARPDVIATGNPGCIMQLRLGVQQAGLDIPVVIRSNSSMLPIRQGGNRRGRGEGRGE